MVRIHTEYHDLITQNFISSIWLIIQQSAKIERLFGYLLPARCKKQGLE